MKLIICFSIVLSLSVGCSTSSSERNPSSLPQVVEGTFYKVDRILPDASSLKKIREELIKDGGDEVKSTLNASAGIQRASRIVGLKFCKDRGFAGMGAVFWSGRNKGMMTGVHCIKNAEQRSSILQLSYGLGCKALNYTRPSNGSCIDRIQQAEGHQFERMIDLNKDRRKNSENSGID
jgi:hypothetical protein